MRRYSLLIAIAAAAVLLQLPAVPVAAQSSIITPKVAANPGTAVAADNFAALCTVTASQKAALSQFLFTVQAAGIWDKLLAYYPFIGGTAACHKWNLKDLRDVDAAYRLTYSGANPPTHSAAGMLNGGGSGFIDTKFVPSVDWPATYTFGFRGSVSNFTVLSGSRALGSNDGTGFIHIQSNGGNVTFFGGQGSVGTAGNEWTPGSGGGVVWSGSRSTSSMTLYNNGTAAATGTNWNGRPAFSIYLGASNNSGSAGNQPSEIRFQAVYFAKSELTAGEISTLAGAINALQTALGR
jgi:hypothetical protein